MRSMFRALSGVAMMAIAVPTVHAQAQRQQAAAALPAAAPVADLIAQVDIPYESFTLDNGLTVLVHTDRKAPIVGVSVWYDVGSKHEPKGKTGFAHLFEHLMFNGTENAPGDYFEPLRAIGATDLNGTTSFDRTNYFQTVPRAALDRILFLESDRMGYLLGAVTQRNLDNQIGVVQNEKRQGDNQPYGLVRYKMSEGLFPVGHPYHHSTIGSMADLQAASLEDVKTWFRSYYGPNNAIIALAGDIDVATARPLMEKYFGAIPRGPETKLPPAPVPTLPAPVAETMNDRVANTRLYRMWAVPGLRETDAHNLTVAAGVLGGLASSRLDRELVRGRQLAVSAASYNQSFAQVGIFMVQMDVRPGVDAAEAGRALDALIADFIKNGPTEDEIQRVATTTVARRLGGLEQVGGFGGKAATLASGALFADDPAHYKKELAAIAAATPQSVRAAAAKWLTRPVYALTVQPGEREAYVEPGTTPAAPTAAAQATNTAQANAAPTPAAADGPAQGTRGALPPVADIRDIDFPDVQRARLSNGIELVYARQQAVPTTQAIVSFDAGQVADPAGKLGLANFTLAAIDEGTTTRDVNALAEAQERLGARISTGNDADRSFVSLFTPSPNLDGSVALLGDIVRNPAFADSEIERLRGQTLARIAAELTNPGALAARRLPGLLYGDSAPYAKLAAGTGDPAAVKGLTRADLAAFHQAWLRPDKAKIFVVSDRPLAEVQAAFERQFGNWRANGAAGAKSFTARPTQASPRIVLIDRPDSPQSLIAGGQITGLDPKGELLPEFTANEVLGSGFLSRINMDLREEKGWSYGARGGFNRMEHAVPYIVNAPVQADKTGPALASLREQVSGFLSTSGVTPAEFERTINGETRELAGNFETSGAVLAGMQANDLYGRPDNYYDTITQKYRALTPQQLDAAARGTIDPAKWVWVVVGDASQVRGQLDSLGLPVEVVPASAVGGSAAPRAN
ncbi:M16 family metallopeptidase [Sphingomonas baiyangensis]|uniref:Insulinase family protein n=1 Tax=Sphingomonas baiyangensis TaxID=2572576 RepID=A0A4U1L571_9SPHN|nr:pitrilysin family protein [Sphingomonas baiyangensis]TKD51714.1 insulinase family protein [Sphingomonas baiyangensis]